MKVELGAEKFNENLRWLLCEWGQGKGELGRRAFGPRRKAENARRKICRLQSGYVDLKIRDVEAIAGVFNIPPCVLVYGTKKQLKKSWALRHRIKE